MKDGKIMVFVLNYQNPAWMQFWINSSLPREGSVALVPDWLVCQASVRKGADPEEFRPISFLGVGWSWWWRGVIERSQRGSFLIPILPYSLHFLLAAILTWCPHWWENGVIPSAYMVWEVAWILSFLSAANVDEGEKSHNIVDIIYDRLPWPIGRIGVRYHVTLSCPIFAEWPVECPLSSVTYYLRVIPHHPLKRLRRKGWTMPRFRGSFEISCI